MRSRPGGRRREFGVPLLMIVFSEIPVFTYILAAYDGSLFAFLAVTLSALLPCGVRESWMPLTSVPLPRKYNGEKSR